MARVLLLDFFMMENIYISLKFILEPRSIKKKSKKKKKEKEIKSLQKIIYVVVDTGVQQITGYYEKI